MWDPLIRDAAACLNPGQYLPRTLLNGIVPESRCCLPAEVRSPNFAPGTLPASLEWDVR